MLVWTNDNHGIAGDPGLNSRQLHDTLVLPAESTGGTDDARAAPRLMPTSVRSPGIAALLVPTGLPGRVARNGVPLPPGAHVLQHADRVDYDGRAYWVAAASEVGAVPYDAAVHGEDVYCFITKSRIRDGEPIVVCPGRPGAECHAIYRQVAWDMALESNVRFRCPRCGFEPAAAEWRPTLPRPSGLPKLFALARQYRRGDGQ
jgi:hypothetical protein